MDINEEKMQLSKFTSSDIEVITVYRSEQGNMTKLQQFLESMITPNLNTIVCGDFNFCYLSNRGNKVTQFLENSGFQQLVNEATHIKGRHLDQFYIKLEDTSFETDSVFRYSPYYTDHDAICVTISKPDKRINAATDLPF